MNMNLFKRGDKLLSNLGGKFMYVSKDDNNSPYRHKVKFLDGQFKGSFGTRLDDGRVAKKSLPSDHIIIGYYLTKDENRNAIIEYYRNKDEKSYSAISQNEMA